MGRLEAGRIFILLNRGDSWQCGFVIAKGSRATLESRGLESSRAAVAQGAPFLAEPLRRGGSTPEQLERVQARRDWPTRMSQRLQLALQRRVIQSVLAAARPLAPPLALRLLARLPFLRHIPGRLIRMGFRPEHVRSPAR